MRHFLLLLIILVVYSCAVKNDNFVVSPNQKNRFHLIIDNGKLYYEISCENKIIIEKSAIGFEFKNQAALDDSLKIVSIENSSHDETWKPIYGRSENIRNNYNEIVITLQENSNLKRNLKLIARAYDEGVAFRYFFPESNVEDSLLITAENTEFNFPENDSAWWIPSNEFAYESLFRNTALKEIKDANTPITIKNRNGLYLSIHEAALLDYSEMYLKKTQDNTTKFTSALWPEPDGVCCSVALPFKTPWRCILIESNAGKLAESSLILNLNEPCVLKDVSYIKPIKFVGIWWGMHIGEYTWFAGPKHGATTERTKQYIDFAAKHHIQGVLTEGWNLGWETWASGVKPIQNFSKAYPDFDLEEVVKYARQKNVEYICHHETGGNIPEYEKQMDTAFALLHKLGVKYLKTGYAGTIIPEGYHHHGQYMVRHFQKVVETAAKYQICLDAHESIKPSGIERTYPNLMSQEVIRGNEWNATYKATPPYHATILPFTRFVAGSADFTPGIFRINHSPKTNKRLYCTLTHQLSLFVVFYSPMMMASDMIENYENNKAFSFIEEVPCTWHQTKTIDAVPGDYACIARRNNDKWFVGSVADENCHLIKIPLSFLKKGQEYIATIYSDSSATDWKNNPESFEIASYKVTSVDTVYAALSKAGGHAMMLFPADKRNVSTNLKGINSNNKEALIKMEIFSKLDTYGNKSVTHTGFNKPVHLVYPYSGTYPASGNNAVTDGIRGDYNLSAGDWQGYEGSDINLTVDLQKETTIKRIAAGFLNSPNDWIFYPKHIEFYYSSDSKNFVKAGEEKFSHLTPENMNAINIRDFEVKLNNVKARYVRVKASGLINCPQWHYGKGKKSWMFCDEIIVE